MGVVVAFHLFRMVMVNMVAQYIYAFAAWLVSQVLDGKKKSKSEFLPHF
jgi:hypothetical protein